MIMQFDMMSHEEDANPPSLLSRQRVFSFVNLHPHSNPSLHPTHWSFLNEWPHPFCMTALIPLLRWTRKHWSVFSRGNFPPCEHVMPVGRFYSAIICSVFWLFHFTVFFLLVILHIYIRCFVGVIVLFSLSPMGTMCQHSLEPSTSRRCPCRCCSYYLITWPTSWMFWGMLRRYSV